MELYDPVLQPWVDREITLLEIGVLKGGSLLLWRDYFAQGTIVGIDINLPEGFVPTERIRVHQGSQSDPIFLTEVARREAPEGFDIIIDDASHFADLTRKSFWHLFDNHLKPGGLYVIEDWGTGYWDDWPDGASYRPEKRRQQELWARLLVRLKISRNARRKLPAHCHSYGMVGFVKELVDEQGAADMTRSRLSGTPKRRSKFESVLIKSSIVFVRKSFDPS
jgi:hypothetical protein